MGAIVVIYVLIFALMIVSMWVIFAKAGKPGWASIIPIYNAIVFLEIIGKPWWHIFLLIIPIYGWIILPIMWIHKLSKAFGKDVGFTLGLIFLGIIFYPILAFSDIKYIGPEVK